MEPPRRSNLNRDLPWRMYHHGLSYRVHLPDGRKVNLGRDYDGALLAYQILMGDDSGDQYRQPAAVMEMILRHAKGAKQRGILFSINCEQVAAVMERQGYRCAVTLMPFRGGKPPGSRIRPWLPSIDRINSSKGYEPGNIRVVCAFVNVALNAFGEQCFAQILEPLIEAQVRLRMAGGVVRIPTDPAFVPIAT